jgi:hypothetical protein
MFWSNCLYGNNNFQTNWWIIFSYIIFIIHLKFHKNTSYNFTFEIYFSFFILCDKYYFGHIKKFHLLLTFFFLKNWLSQVSKFSKFPKVHNIIIKCGVHILSKFWNLGNCVPWQQFWGTLLCLWSSMECVYASILA